MHQRAAIRNWAAARLSTPDEQGAYPTPAGDNVLLSYIWPLSAEDELPALIIYTQDEEVRPELGYMPAHDPLRTVELVVEYTAQVDLSQGGDPVEAFDEVTRIIELLILADPTLGQNADDTDYDRTEMGLAYEGAEDLITARVIFKVTYHHEDQEEPTLDEFLQGFLELDLTPDQEGGDVKTTFNVRE